MQTTRVAAVSMNGFLGEPGRVLEAIDTWCGRAAAQQIQLVLFPELVIHGHCTPNTWALAEPVPEGPSVRRLEEITHRHGLVLCAGLSEKERDIVYNTQVLVGPEGYIGKQRKLHLSREEMITATLEWGLLAQERALANYMLRTRRPELFGELLRDQVDA